MLPLLLLLVGSALSARVPVCKVTDWSSWSECVPSRVCAEEVGVQNSYSFPGQATKEYDRGRQNMKMMIEEKKRQRVENARCIEEGKCAPVPRSFSDAPCVDGMANGYPCMNVDILSFVNFDGLGYGTGAWHPDETKAEGNDIWGWTDPVTGDEWAIVGITGGTSFVKVTDPYNPVTMAFMYTRNSVSIWRDMKVIDNTAYIVSEDNDHGLQVFDLERLRSMTQFEVVTPDTLYSEFGNAHNIVSNEESKYLYVVGATQRKFPKNCDGGLHIIDVSGNRLNPQFVSCFDTDGYTHDAQCVIYRGPDSAYQGQEVCFCYNEDSLTIVNVQDKQNMFVIAKEYYSGSQYTHQGWLAEDQSVLFLDDELDEYYSGTKNTRTYVWDINQLAYPVLRSTYMSSQNSIDHNQYVKGDYTYQANYEAGLRILHINQADYSLNEVGYLDVLPSRTSANFYGTWSVYPYFSSGVVVINSIDYGLFVSRPNMAAMEEQAKSVYAQRTRTREILFATETCGAMEEFQRCYAQPAC